MPKIRWDNVWMPTGRGNTLSVVEDGATPSYAPHHSRIFRGIQDPVEAGQTVMDGDIWLDPYEGQEATRAAGDVTFDDSGLEVVTSVSNVQAAIAAVDAALGSAWTSFTPTWTGSTSDPTIGNGTLNGAYKVIGKTFYFRIYVLGGSSTSWGTGLYGFTWPSQFVTIAEARQSCAVTLEDNSGTTRTPAAGYINASDNRIARIVYGTGSGIGNTTPWTWATGDMIFINGVVEIQ
jgi:hypothetical protein